MGAQFSQRKFGWLVPEVAADLLSIGRTKLYGTFRARAARRLRRSRRYARRLAVSREELAVLAARVRAAAAEAGELRPERIGPISIDLPDEVRQAIAEDLASGEYRWAADEATAGDPEMLQR